MWLRAGRCANRAASRSGRRDGPSGARSIERHMADGVRCLPDHDGPDFADYLLAASPGGRINAFVDLFAPTVVDMAIAGLGIAPSRANVIIDFAGRGQTWCQDGGERNRLPLIKQRHRHLPPPALKRAPAYPLCRNGGDIEGSFYSLFGRLHDAGISACRHASAPS